MFMNFLLSVVSGVVVLLAIEHSRKISRFLCYCWAFLVPRAERADKLEEWLSDIQETDKPTTQILNAFCMGVVVVPPAASRAIIWLRVNFKDGLDAVAKQELASKVTLSFSIAGGGASMVVASQELFGPHIFAELFSAVLATVLCIALTAAVIIAISVRSKRKSSARSISDPDEANVVPPAAADE